MCKSTCHARKQKKPVTTFLILRGLKRLHDRRWDKGSLVYTPICWGFFPLPHLPSSYLLSPLTLSGGIARLEASGSRSQDVSRLMGPIGVILGLYGDHGTENGDDNNGLHRV